MIDIKVPTVGESISEVTLLKWIKKEGDYVERDEVIAELESEKATFEVNAEKAGTLKLSANEGDTLKIGDLLATIDESAVAPQKHAVPAEEKKTAEANQPKVENASQLKKEEPAVIKPAENKSADLKATPVASAIIADKNVDPKTVTPSGTQGRILKEDVLNALNNPGRVQGKPLFGRESRKEKMSSLRKTISRRLVEAKKHYCNAHHF